jgi:hypothetical protein
MQHVAFSKLALNSLDRYGPCDYKSGERTLSSFVDRLVCLSIRLCMCVCVCALCRCSSIVWECIQRASASLYRCRLGYGCSSIQEVMKNAASGDAIS